MYNTLKCWCGNINLMFNHNIPHFFGFYNVTLCTMLFARHIIIVHRELDNIVERLVPKSKHTLNQKEFNLPWMGVFPQCLRCPLITWYVKQSFYKISKMFLMLFVCQCVCAFVCLCVCVFLHTLGHLKFLLFFRAADFSSCMQQLLLLISSLVFNAKTNLICLFFVFR